ncbi:MAG: SDR family oxidoreductase [Chloroflexota bacterium]|nr:SDR family oxidoreductase [Chloroflexota bacterium]
MPNSPLILVTGATGYVGGRLVPRLLEAGYRVRCLVRDPKRLEGRSWLKRVDVMTGDALMPDTLTEAMRDVSAAYYLIHGKQGGQVNASLDLDAARNFARAAAEAGVGRIIYLGELVDPTTNLSPYLRARHETGAILRHNRVPVTEFRAGMIVGSGSALFEMIRYLTEREPVLICPAWFFSEAQPIAIRDVLSYLIEALGTPESTGRMIEIGGPTRLTYADMLLGYAKERELKRILIRTPFYAPRLSAYWVHMVTPIHWRVVLPLIEGLRARLIVRDEAAKKLFPQIKPIDFQKAVHLALGRIQRDHVETSWSDALVTVAGHVTPYQWTMEEGMFIETRQRVLDLSPDPVFRSYAGIGGERGWLYMDWAWGIRGWLDKAIGGVGLRRGRRHPDEVRAGESLDFWRVEEVEKNRLLRLRAEMKLPGKAWLQFESQPQDGKTLLTVTAYFAPYGLFGFLYWYAMWPFHKFIFDGLANRIASRARVLAH